MKTTSLINAIVFIVAVIAAVVGWMMDDAFWICFLGIAGAGFSAGVAVTFFLSNL